MRIMDKRNALMVLPMMAGLFCVSVATAQTAGNLVLNAVAEVEIEQAGTDGGREVVRIPAQTVVPGDEVIYTLTYDNQGGEPADDIFITNPIPEHMELRHAASNPAWLETVYSVDGGQVFGPLSELTVTDSAGQNHRWQN